MKRIVPLTVFVVLCLSVFTAQAQVVNPKEAIVGAWVIDLESVLKAVENAENEDEKMGLMMMLGMASANVYEIKPNGDLIAGGAEEAIPLMFEVDDEGILWGMPKDGGGGQYFQGVRFESRDRCVLIAREDQPVAMELHFKRFVPAGMLEQGEVAPETEKRIEGAWTVDQEHLRAMPWVHDVSDPEKRESMIDHIFGEDGWVSIGFKSGQMYVIMNGSDEFSEPVPYEILAADDRIVAISTPFGGESILPFLVRIEIINENNIEFWFTHLSAGPVPMTRNKDVALP